MPDRSTDSDLGLFEYPTTRGGAEYVGAIAGGAPVYYDRDSREWLEGEHAPEEDPRWSSRQTLPEDREVGDHIRDVHEESGWEHLADWAREHVPGFGDGDDEADSDHADDR